MNVLILNCGFMDEIVKYYVQHTRKGVDVLITSEDENATALLEAEEYFIVKKTNEEDYVKQLVKICDENYVGMVFSYVKEDLAMLDRNRQKFQEVGTQPVIIDFKHLPKNVSI